MRSVVQRLTLCFILIISLTSFATVAAADDANARTEQLGSIDISIENKHVMIDEIEISSQSLPTIGIDERTYAVDSFSLHANGVTIEYNGQSYNICQVNIDLENVGITVSDISINHS